jgi:phage terminase large subunit-like protein
MPWQMHVLEGMLAVDADQKFVHRSSLVSVARQNGKTTIIQALILVLACRDAKDTWR